MIIDTLSIPKCLLSVFILLCGAVFFITGCEKKELPNVSKAVVVKEKEGPKEKEAEGVVTLSAEKQKASGIEVQKVTLGDVAVPISATAMLEPNADRIGKAGARTSGKIASILVSQGERVRTGQTLATFDSAEIDETWAAHRKAESRVELLRANLKREETLFALKISPEKDVLKARQELSEAETDHNLTIEKLRLFGINIVTHFQHDGKEGPHPLIPIAAPLDGVIIEKTVTLGEVVTPEKVLFTIVDLSTLWVVIDVYEKDMSHLKVGTNVKVSVTALPDKVFRGRISYVSDLVDEKTRTIKARVTIDNAANLLKPGMFASVLIDSASGQRQKFLSLPDEAILMDGTARYVFVQAAPDRFGRRDIRTGRTLSNKTEVLEGLKEGETIAVKGAFILKSELNKASLEAE